MCNHHSADHGHSSSDPSAAQLGAPLDAESQRLAEDHARKANWKRWGPYLSERQWGTVREDYSHDGNCWESLPHDHARSRAYRWGEDGLLGICDRQCRLCFGLAVWNGRDPILKERLFGLTNGEGNHGEDVKECYFYLDSTPTHSFMKALYRYPQEEFPYRLLIEENRRRGPDEPEFEIADTGVFDGDRFFDIVAEYAKAEAEDLLIRVTVVNHGPEAAPLDVLPTLWFRNTWSWGRQGEGHDPRPCLRKAGPGRIEVEHHGLGRFVLDVAPGPDGSSPELLFTENETNNERLYGHVNRTPHVKDAFHALVVEGRRDAVNPACEGTKSCARFSLVVPSGGKVVLRLRLRPAELGGAPAFGDEFERIFDQRQAEADEFHHRSLPATLSPEERQVARQATAGLLWSKQFYHYVVEEWLDGDPGHPPPPPQRRDIRNGDWRHLFNRDVISMPDAWEYPWYAAWDLAFHAIPLARVDPDFAKSQLLLVLREWYMHPNGQIPAYEFSFSDVNPPVHAWACWRVYKMTAPRGQRDRAFLAKAFQKLLINFTWWVNRKDVEGHHLFSGGFLGLDNIGVFDRSRPLPTGGHLEQADGTAWMAFYCLTMLAMALELASEDPAYEDVASKFFEHFVAIADAMNSLGGTGLWNDEEGFYYDQLHVDGGTSPLRVRSMVGLIPLIAVEVLEEETLRKLPGFRRRMRWFLENRPLLARHIFSYEPATPEDGHAHHLLAIPSRERLTRVLQAMLDESEFLSPFGLRSLSQIHRGKPFVLGVDGVEFRVEYEPGESRTRLFGGNSNWRGPVWFPVNHLVIEALERYHHYYGDDLTVECPTGSGRRMNLAEVAQELRRRLAALFLPGQDGARPCHRGELANLTGPAWSDLVLFHEHFDGDSGRGLGASHQTGWTALVLECLGSQPPGDASEETLRSAGNHPVEARIESNGSTRRPGTRQRSPRSAQSPPSARSGRADHGRLRMDRTSPPQGRASRLQCHRKPDDQHREDSAPSMCTPPHRPGTDAVPASMLTCRELIQFLDDYLDRSLDDGTRRAFEHHLEGCLHCRDFLKTYRDSIRMARSLCSVDGDRIPDSVPEDLVQAVVKAGLKVRPSSTDRRG